MNIGLAYLVHIQSKYLENTDEALELCSDIHNDCVGCPELRDCQRLYDTLCDKLCNRYKSYMNEPKVSPK